jgi:hypothetical protein
MSEPVCHTFEDGTQEWLLPDGRLHRTDGPARIYPSGTQSWWQNGRRHRTDGPALVRPDGTQWWYLNGQRHRTDGPAVIQADGLQEWYIEDQWLTQQEVELYRFRRWAVEGELI